MLMVLLCSEAHPFQGANSWHRSSKKASNGFLGEDAMIMDTVVQRFVEQTPVTVMARLTLQCALDATWIDTLFEQHRQTQYTRELLFSTTVEVMSVVAVGLQPSVHAAAKACKDLPVSITALYDKINRTEPDIVRALVQGSAERLEPVLQPMRQAAPTVPGYRLRILDGNHLAASEKRLKPLRGFRGAALPGQSLVVYDPDTGLVVDLVPCEDAHCQERSLMDPLLQAAQPDELWIGDRNFCTRPILAGWHGRGSAFLVREHGRTPNPSVCTALRKIGRIATGRVWEQQVSIDDDAGQPLVLRRIELQLDTPTEDGDTVIRLLTNLPSEKVDAKQAAQLYRRRWQIENLFQKIESALNSEIATLGQPRAALLAFGVAVLAHNVLAVLQTAVTAQHKLVEAGKMELSAYFLALQIRAHYAGMMVAVAACTWQAFEALTPKQLARTLLQIASKADVRQLCKHPRGPKAEKKKGYVSASQARKHVSTARVLQAGRVV
jgi:IS4 transposase